MTSGKRKAKLISKRECRRILLEKLPGKKQVSESAIDKVEAAAGEELECIVLENTGRAGVTVV